MNQQINVTLKEVDNNNAIKVRDLDISNFTDWDTGRIADTKVQQLQMLYAWIEERGVDQHDSKLEVITWYIH